MKIQKQFFYVLLSSIAVFGAACSDMPAPTTNANANRAVVTNSNTNPSANTAATPTASPTTATAGSPVATVAAYHQAMFKKDEAAFRKVLSNASLREISAEATAEKKNLVEFWTEFSPPQQPTAETRNERISGETAYIEVKSPKSGEWVLSKLVRENNEWKMDLTSAAAAELSKQKPTK